MKDLVVLILWMSEDNTVFEEHGLGLWWTQMERRRIGHGLQVLPCGHQRGFSRYRMGWGEGVGPGAASSGTELNSTLIFHS